MTPNRTRHTSPAKVLGHHSTSSIFGTLRLLVLFSAFATFAASVNATNYYVRKDGSDTNTGTANTATGAWLTIQKAANAVAAGDTVTVNAGTYAEFVSVTKAGTSGAAITFQGTGPVIAGGFNVTGNYIVVKDIDLNGAGVSINQGRINLGSSASYCTFSNMALTGTLTGTAGAGGVRIAPGTSTGCVFDNVRLNNVNDHGFTIFGSNHTIKNCTLLGQNGWDAFRVFGTNIHITHNTITDWSNLTGNSNHTDLFQTFGNNHDVSKYIYVEDNIVLSASGCQFGNITDDQNNGDISNWTFRNNILCNISNTLNLYAPNCSFLNNTFYRVGPVSAFAIVLSGSTAGHADNAIIKNNIFYQCGDPTRANRGWYYLYNVVGTDADYNLVVGTGAGTVKTGFQTAGLEAHGLNGIDPLFASPGTDFHLQSTSPCIGAALPLSNLFTIDETGMDRGTSWDLGALEYAGSPLNARITQNVAAAP